MVSASSNLLLEMSSSRSPVAANSLTESIWARASGVVHDEESPESVLPSFDAILTELVVAVIAVLVLLITSVAYGLYMHCRLRSLPTEVRRQVEQLAAPVKTVDGCVQP